MKANLTHLSSSLDVARQKRSYGHASLSFIASTILEALYSEIFTGSGGPKSPHLWQLSRVSFGSFKRPLRVIPKSVDT
jgi:hypothetical protein